MGISSWIIIGLIAGVLAKWITPGKDPGGIIVTILIGIAGAIVGGFVVGLFTHADFVTGINITTVIVATDVVIRARCDQPCSNAQDRSVPGRSFGRASQSGAPGVYCA
jgi:uncharacterized membrane protein YeaQ/YmgE (transglycosylase-associated protein family)